MKKLFFGLSFFLLWLTSSASADRVDDLVRRELKLQKIPGASIAVVRDGKIVKAAGYGFANLEHRVPAKPETIYQSGSIGKMFTASLVMLLARDGKLSIDDPVRKYLPEVPESWNAVTIRHLLTHTSGLADPYAKLDLHKDYTDAELLKFEGEVPLLFAPGEKWSYSNMGYHVLGFLCNRVGGKFYGDQLNERIFAPLKMETRIIDEAQIIPHRAAGYRPDEKGALQNQNWVAPKLNTTADGSLYLTVNDLARWDAALYTDSPLDRATRERMWTPGTLNSGEKTNYGFGWQLRAVNGHRQVHHGGAWQGFTTKINRYPDDKLTVVVLTNRSRCDPGRIADQIAQMYLPALAPKPIQDTEPQITALLREAWQQTVSGTIKPERFTDDMRKQLFPEGIKAFGEELKEMGAIRSLALLARREKEGIRTYQYLLKCDDTYRLIIDLDKENRIADWVIN